MRRNHQAGWGTEISDAAKRTVIQYESIFWHTFAETQATARIEAHYTRLRGLDLRLVTNYYAAWRHK